MIRFKLITLLIVVLLSVSSCNLTRTEMKEPYCPKPENLCKPGSASSIRDSSEYAEMLRTGGYYLRELNLNSDNNEWQITFQGGEVFLSLDSDRVQHIEQYRKIEADKFRFIQNIESPRSYHTGNIRFSGRESYCGAGETSDENPFRQIDLFKCSLNSNKITLNDKINFAGKNLRSGWKSQPAFSPDGNFIFFVCDDDSGLGGTDIYYSRKIGNQWSEPHNCGENINTPCNELSPFVTNDGKFLYFASQGHATYGGYDLFRSQISFDSGFPEFSAPQNLLEPINSPFDELFAESPENEDSLLYFSSNRKGSFDIYVMLTEQLPNSPKYKKSFKVKHKPANPLINNKTSTLNDTKIKIDSIAITDSSNTFLLKGKIYSARTKLPLSDAGINIEWHDSLKTEFSDDRGAYSLSLMRGDPYEVSVHKQYYSYDKYFFNSDSVPRGGVVEHDFYLPDFAVIRINFPFDNYTEPYNNTLDSNGNETNVTWVKELDIAAQDILVSLDKIDKIVLVGHTDDQGTKEYNTGLGLRRVNFVIDELVKRGVPRNIIVSRSAGKSEPLIQKKDEDIESFRKRLRRVVLEKFYK